MQTAICYFSGTGNTFYIANEMNRLIPNSTVLAIPTLDENALYGYDRIIIASPIYLFGLPNPVKALIAKLSPLKDKIFYMVLNYGGFSGNAVNFTHDLFEDAKLSLQGVYKMKMPENFTFYMTVPHFYIKKTMKSAPKRISRIAARIHNSDTTKKTANPFSFCNKVHEKGQAAWPTLANQFTIADSCNRCKLCEQICPQNNIVVTTEKITFCDNCASCLACYHRCPQKAINYLDKTQNKERYVNPSVDFSEMI